MAAGLLTPLQLSAGAALLDNTGIVTYTTSLNSYNSFYLITAWQAAVNYYVAQPWSTPGTLTQLLSMGNSTCAALGNSIPTGAPTPRPVTGPVNTGFSGLIKNTGDLYLGNGDVSKFTQAYAAALALVNSTNVFVNSAVNAQTYLGPTFSDMNALTTNNISQINSNIQGFGIDLFRQGQLVNLARLQDYGTPAALLRQLSDVAGLQGGTLRVVQDPLVLAGLTEANIRTLIQGNRSADSLTFDRYQSLAYQGMTQVTGSALQQVLDILDVTTPNINTMADLLNQQKIFPNSYTTLSTPTATGTVSIYLPDGGVNMQLADTVAQYMPTASGCEELGKVVPPVQAVASKAVQSAYQQITGISQSTLPALAQVVLGQPVTVWNANKEYLPNVTVRYSDTEYYRSQQNVPAGASLTDTEYWQPTSLGGLSTMAGLPLVLSQTQAITNTTASFYNINLATGTGPNGTLTLGDVLGAAAGYGYSDNLTTVVANLQILSDAGALTALLGIYQSMLSTANDGAMLTLISQANAAIATVVSNNSSVCNIINTAWFNMAANLHAEYVNQVNANIVWADIPADNRLSVQSFVQSLPQSAVMVDAGGPAWFLNQIADTTTAGGQALVGSLREARNNRRLSGAQLAVDTTPSTKPAVTPSPRVVPVY